MPVGSSGHLGGRKGAGTGLGGVGGGRSGGAATMSHTGLLLSTPFVGLTFVPQESAPHVDMLRVACHRLGQPDKLDPSPIVAFNAEKANIVRNAFELPKIEVAANAAAGKTTTANNNNQKSSTTKTSSIPPAPRTNSTPRQNTNNQQIASPPAHQKGDYVLSSTTTATKNNNNNTNNNQQPQPPVAASARPNPSSTTTNSTVQLQPLSYTARVAPPPHQNNNNASTLFSVPQPIGTLSLAELKQRKAPSSSPPRNLPSLPAAPSTTTTTTSNNNNNNVNPGVTSPSKMSVTPPAKIGNDPSTNTTANNNKNTTPRKTKDAVVAPVEKKQEPEQQVETTKIKYSKKQKVTITEQQTFQQCRNDGFQRKHIQRNGNDVINGCDWKCDGASLDRE